MPTFPLTPAESCLCSVVCATHCHMCRWLKHKEPIPPLSLGRAQEPLLTCDTDDIHGMEAKRGLMRNRKN